MKPLEYEKLEKQTQENLKTDIYKIPKEDILKTDLREIAKDMHNRHEIKLIDIDFTPQEPTKEQSEILTKVSFSYRVNATNDLIKTIEKKPTALSKASIHVDKDNLIISILTQFPQGAQHEELIETIKEKVRKAKNFVQNQVDEINSKVEKINKYLFEKALEDLETRKAEIQKEDDLLKALAV